MNLHHIVIGMVLYQNEYGVYPSDLRKLVDAGQPPMYLLSHFSQNQPDDAVTKPYAGPCDYSYFPEVANQDPNKPLEDLIWIWQDPRFNNGEGGWVVISTTVNWLPAEELWAEVAKTKKWIAEHPESRLPRSGRPGGTHPTSMPASAEGVGG